MPSADSSRASKKARPAPVRRLALPRLTIGRRFGVVALLVVPLVASVCVIGALGVNEMEAQVSELYEDEYTHTLSTAKLSRSLAAAEAVALHLVLTDEDAIKTRLNGRLGRRLLPAVDVALGDANALIGVEGARATRPLGQVKEDLVRFERLRTASFFDAPEETEAVAKEKDRLAARISGLFERMRARADGILDDEASEARVVDERARSRYRSTLLLLFVGSVIALLATLAVIAWLTRSIVPRARAYSGFAIEVAEGIPERRLDPTGNDELTELGVLLNGMVDHREREQLNLDQQTEFSEAMQVTESEQEAYGLLKRHLERSLEGADVTVLSRNNSADRLEPRTPLTAGGPLGIALGNHSKPRSCLAIRTGEQHSRINGEARLLDCELCGAFGPSACQPLLVGGEVMGSVLALPEGPLSQEERESMRLSVAQAAPILANLRNLAIAEQRAETDELTGLANQRAGNNVVKRMVAEASSDAPLGAIVLDLDHFKQINDVFGHGAGDEVLAAVGATLRTTLRPADFCARWGGEEFLVLLPGTDTEGSRAAAENLRAAIERIQVPSVQRTISASLGVAAMPAHAEDADVLVRSADRALYAAKAAGRNRVEVVAGPAAKAGATNGAAATAEPAPAPAATS